MSADSSDPYLSLKIKLEETSVWPGKYVYKFIYPDSPETEDQIRSFFNENVKVSRKLSSGGKYCSLTIKGYFESPEVIISIYKKASMIKGVMAL